MCPWLWKGDAIHTPCLGGTARGRRVRLGQSQEQEPEELLGGMAARQAGRKGTARENPFYSLFSINLELPHLKELTQRETS